jgi:hypothetical protein
MAQKTDLVLKRGSTYVQPIEATYPSGSPVDLTDWKLQFMAKASFDDADENAVIDVTVPTSGDPTTGVAEFTIEAAITKDFPVGNFIYAYQVIDPTGFVAETEAGRLEIRADVIQGIS